VQRRPEVQLFQFTRDYFLRMKLFTYESHGAESNRSNAIAKIKIPIAFNFYQIFPSPKCTTNLYEIILVSPSLSLSLLQSFHIAIKINFHFFSGRTLGNASFPVLYCKINKKYIIYSNSPQFSR
jgi:hypothetical protein